MFTLFYRLSDGHGRMYRSSVTIKANRGCNMSSHVIFKFWTLSQALTNKSSWGKFAFQKKHHGRTGREGTLNSSHFTVFVQTDLFHVTCSMFAKFFGPVNGCQFGESYWSKLGLNLLLSGCRSQSLTCVCEFSWCTDRRLGG